MLDVEQKKGDPAHLHGRVTVYAIIDIDLSDLASMKHPVASMVHNGLLVAQGNFKEQSSLRDFLQKEMGISLEEGLEEGLTELLDKMEGLESALDPQKLRERLENMDEINDLLPTPAKIVPFQGEEEILGQEGDVFFTGVYKNVSNAVLSINALPILYQARFREQEIQKVRSEIELLISQIERNEKPVSRAEPAPTGTMEERLLKEFIPNLLYNRKDSHGFAEAERQLRSFMSSYQFHEEVDEIVAIIGRPGDLTSRDYRLVELYARKISAVIGESFGAADDILREIQRLRGERGT